jgi:hypothetical protein
MLCGGNFITTEVWPRQKILEAGAYATMVILPFPGDHGAIAIAAGHAA